VLAPGVTLNGAYVIRDVCGEGGMAIVYRAWQPARKRIVAVKSLHPRLAANPEFLRRFQAEADALASIRHPNIVSAFDRGVHESHYYFVMEYVDGETLDSLILGDRMDMTMWRRVVKGCRDALGHLHRRGMAHLDIKPSNILVDCRGRVKLGDFGIARIVGPDPELMKADGTSSYMAPERRADPSTVDCRSDIYSLGLAFYKMFARRNPTSLFPTPSQANPKVPPAIDDVIFRATRPDPETRYQDVRNFCDDLLRAMRTDPRDRSLSARLTPGRLGRMLVEAAEALAQRFRRPGRGRPTLRRSADLNTGQGD